MSEMVERVARAIGATYDGYVDPVETPNNWLRATSAARAAIEAMREPTDEMLKQEGIHTNCQMCGGHLEGWRLMVDEALKP